MSFICYTVYGRRVYCWKPRQQIGGTPCGKHNGLKIGDALDSKCIIRYQNSFEYRKANCQRDTNKPESDWFSAGTYTPHQTLNIKPQISDLNLYLNDFSFLTQHAFCFKLELLPRIWISLEVELCGGGRRLYWSLASQRRSFESNAESPETALSCRLGVCKSKPGWCAQCSREPTPKT